MLCLASVDTSDGVFLSYRLRILWLCMRRSCSLAQLRTLQISHISRAAAVSGLRDVNNRLSHAQL